MKGFRSLLIVLGCFLPALAFAIPRDTLFAIGSGDGWTLMQRVMQGETPASVSRRFHVPVAVLAAANGVGSMDRLQPGSLVIVPIGPYNFLSQPPQAMSEVRPLYYRVAAGDRVRSIARRAGISADELAGRNGINKEELLPGQVLLVGWLRYDVTMVRSSLDANDSLVIPAPPGDTAKPVVVVAPAQLHGDTLPVAGPPKALSLSQLYKEQTFDGKNVVTERGSTGFFPLTKSAAGAAVYAFHNTASKGSVMIVRNLNNGKAIYVKVLGPLPQTKAFSGCILGLSNQAKAALGVHENKAFCELSYPAY